MLTLLVTMFVITSWIVMYWYHDANKTLRMLNEALKLENDTLEQELIELTEFDAPGNVVKFTPRSN